MSDERRPREVLALAFTGSGSFAERSKRKGGGMSEAMPGDQACGRRMNRNKAYAVVRHRGVDYLLCCPRGEKVGADD